MKSIPELGQGHQIFTHKERGGDVHTPHNDKASADVLDGNPKMYIVSIGAREIPAIIVLMVHGIYGIHGRNPVLQQQFQLVLGQCELVLRTHQGTGPTSKTTPATDILRSPPCSFSFTKFKLHLKQLNMLPWSLLLTSPMPVLRFPFGQVLEGRCA